jgi:hypothetical protein
MEHLALVNDRNLAMGGPVIRPRISLNGACDLTLAIVVCLSRERLGNVFVHLQKFEAAK